MIEPGRRRRARAIALGLGICALLIILAQLEAQDAEREAWLATWIKQAEDLGVFTQQAVASGNELMLMERLLRMVKRSDVVYVVIVDRKGLARFAGNPANAGKTISGPYSARALAAEGTLVQEIEGRGIKEIAVPAGQLVVRCGFTMQHLSGVDDWLWIAAALATLGLGGAGLLLLRIS